MDAHGRIGRSGWLLVLVLALVAGAAGLYLVLGHDDGGGEAASAPVVAEAPAAPRAGPGEAPDDTGERATVSAPEPAPTGRPAEGGPADAAAAGAPDGPQETRTLRGLVLEPAGTGLAGAPILLSHGPVEDGTVLGRSDGAARFQLEAPTDAVRLTVGGPTYAPVMDAIVQPQDSGEDVVLVAARRIALAGVVQAQDGGVLEGAKLRVEVENRALARIVQPLDGCFQPRFPYGESAADGSFRLEGVPAVPGGVLEVSCRGYELASVPLPERTREDLVVTLAPSAAGSGDRITGFVFLPDGSPAAGAAVAYSGGRTKTDETGAFALEVRLPRDDTLPLVAAERGHAPALVPDFGSLLRASAPHAPPPQRLVLGADPLAIGGLVVDPDGEPRAHWRVELEEGTPYSDGELPPKLVETLATGARQVETDAAGRFRIEGLLPRDYVLRITDPGSMGLAASDPLPAGTTDARIVIADPPLWPRVAGIVRTQDGAPAPDVSVGTNYVVQQNEHGSVSTGGPSVVTDALGRFEIRDVARRPGYLSFHGQAIVDRAVSLTDDLDVENLDVVVELRCFVRFSFEGDLPDDAQVQCLDAQGNAVSLVLQRGMSRSSYELVSPRSDASGTLAISSSAVCARLVRRTDAGLEELSRTDFTPAPGQVVEVVLVAP